MQLEGFDHITFPVPDLESSERWYCDVLKGHVVMRQGWDQRDVRVKRTRQIWIQVGKDIINLAEGPSLGRQDDNHFYHYALRGHIEDLDAWLDHLEKHGVEVMGPFGHGGSNILSIYFDDPDNYRLEISFQCADFETAKKEAMQRGGKLGNPVAAYDWE